MKKFWTLMVAMIAMSMAFVSCETDEPRDGKNYNDYLEFLLGLPEGVSEEGDKLFMKQIEDTEEAEIVVVLTLTFKNDICEKAICDYVYPSEEMAKMMYEMWDTVGAEMSDVGEAEVSYEKRIFTIDFSKTADLFVGLTREEISNAQGIF